MPPRNAGTYELILAGSGIEPTFFVLE